MIENEEQLKITKEWIKRFSEELDNIPDDEDALSKARADSIRSEIDDLSGQVEEYTKKDLFDWILRLEDRLEISHYFVYNPSVDGDDEDFDLLNKMRKHITSREERANGFGSFDGVVCRGIGIVITLDDMIEEYKKEGREEEIPELIEMKDGISGIMNAEDKGMIVTADSSVEELTAWSEMLEQRLSLTGKTRLENENKLGVSDTISHFDGISDALGINKFPKHEDDEDELTPESE